MDIKSYIKQSSDPGQERQVLMEQMAQFVGVSKYTIRSWSNSVRQCPPRHWRKLKEFSQGKITVFRSDMDS